MAILDTRTIKYLYEILKYDAEDYGLAVSILLAHGSTDEAKLLHIDNRKREIREEFEEFRTKGESPESSIRIICGMRSEYFELHRNQELILKRLKKAASASP